MIRFKLAELLKEAPGSTRFFTVNEGRRKLGNDLTVDFLRGSVEFLRTNKGIFAKGNFQTQVQLQCARCLKMFAQPLTIHLADQFSLSPNKLAEEPEFPIAGDGILDLTPALRERIILNLPIKPLCRPDCLGLCSRCGQNLNEGPCGCKEEAVDPRLAVLKQLL